MSILNKSKIENVYTCVDENKENSLSKTKSTGANKAIAAVALTGILLGGSAACLYRDCSTNDPTEETCLITELETKLFGYEAGLKHHYNDLLTSSSNNYELSNVEYVEPHTVYNLPEGVVLEGRTGVSRVEPIVTKRIYEDGSIETIYEPPAGYVLKSDENGQIYAEGTFIPKKQNVNASISYTKTRSVGLITDEIWSYEDDDFSHELLSIEATPVEEIPVLKLKR